MPPIFTSCAIATPSLFRRLRSTLSAHGGRRSSFGVLPSSLLLLLGECCRPRHLHSVLPGWTFFHLLLCYLGVAFDHPGAAVDGMTQLSRCGLYPADWHRQERPVHWVHSLPFLGPRVAGGRYIKFSWCAIHCDGHAGVVVCLIFQHIVEFSLPRREAAS